jgi:peptidyl-prolyl cis-trans isomerase-like 4
LKSLYFLKSSEINLSIWLILVLERGCFKCGALDHIAKDCTGGPAVNQQTQKYILKDDNRQRGGDNNSRFVILCLIVDLSLSLSLSHTGNFCSYEMVFDGETQESPKQEKSHGGGHDPGDQGEKQKMSRRSSEDPKHRNRDQETKQWSDRHRHNDKSRGYTRDEMSRSRFSGGSKRDGDYFEEKRDREKYKRREVDDIHRDERVYRKRTPDNDSHAERRADGDYRKRNRDSSSQVGSRDEKEYRKRDEENNSSRGRSNGRDYRNDDRDYRKRKAESERHETMDEASEGKRNATGDSYSHKGRREEREDGMRNTSGDTRHQSERRRR